MLSAAPLRHARKLGRRSRTQTTTIHKQRCRRNGRGAPDEPKLLKARICGVEIIDLRQVHAGVLGAHHKTIWPVGACTVVHMDHEAAIGPVVPSGRLAAIGNEVIVRCKIWAAQRLARIGRSGAITTRTRQAARCAHGSVRTRRAIQRSTRTTTAADAPNGPGAQEGGAREQNKTGLSDHSDFRCQSSRPHRPAVFAPRAFPKL